MTEPSSTSSTTRRRRRRAARRRGPRGGTIVLTGGSTTAAAPTSSPPPLEPDWRASSVWWGDERCVRPGDPRSNYGLAQRTLLDRLEHPPEVHRIRGELPPEAAAEYDAALEGVDARSAPPRARPRRPRRLALPRLAAARPRPPGDLRPGRARAVRRPGDADAPGAPLRAGDLVPDHGREQGRDGGSRLSRPDRRGRPRKPPAPQRGQRHRLPRSRRRTPGSLVAESS